MEDIEGPTTKALLDRFKQAVGDANECLTNEEYQQAMALYYDASQSADEMTQRFLSLLLTGVLVEKIVFSKHIDRLVCIGPAWCESQGDLSFPGTAGKE